MAAPSEELDQHLLATTHRIPREKVPRVNDTVPEALGLIFYKEKGEKKKPLHIAGPHTQQRAVVHKHGLFMVPVSHGSVTKTTT